MVESVAEVAGRALVGRLIGCEQCELQRGFAADGCKLEVHLVVGSAGPQRGPRDSMGLFGVKDLGRYFIGGEAEPRPGFRPVQVVRGTSRRLMEALATSAPATRSRSCSEPKRVFTTRLASAGSTTMTAAEADVRCGNQETGGPFKL